MCYSTGSSGAMMKFWYSHIMGWLVDVVFRFCYLVRKVMGIYPTEWLCRYDMLVLYVVNIELKYG